MASAAGIETVKELKDENEKVITCITSLMYKYVIDKAVCSTHTACAVCIQVSVWVLIFAQ